jgi:hypothetical protein
MRTKILAHHKPGCQSLEEFKKGVWRTPWAFIEDKTLYLDSLGRKNGSGRPWKSVRCNFSNLGCPGHIIFLEDDVIEQLPSGE